MMRRLRYGFWKALASMFQAIGRFCRDRQARYCACEMCWFVRNRQELVRRALVDVLIAQDAQKPGAKIDRRPSQ